MMSFKSAVVLCLLGAINRSSAVTSQYHRSTTSLDELRDIDSLVSTGLPIFNHGFFISTASGPVLVKSGLQAKNSKKPTLNPGYYSTLPRVVPDGFEGIAISHFNLGTEFPAQAPVDRRYFEEPQPQYPQQQPSEYLHTQYSQNFAPQLYQHQPQQPQQIQNQQQQQSQSQQYIRHHIRSQQEEPFQLQSQSQSQQQHQRQPEPQRQQRFLSQRPAPVNQDTFQDNFLTAGDVPTSYQNQVISHSRASSNQFTPNPTVLQAFNFDETLPENLRNPFYRRATNEQLAALAQESLPSEGETVVAEWETSKIKKTRIEELLKQYIN